MFLSSRILKFTLQQFLREVSKGWKYLGWKVLNVSCVCFAQPAEQEIQKAVEEEGSSKKNFIFLKRRRTIFFCFPA
jgi:hypothetical protein